MTDIREYIAFRYPNWLCFARNRAKYNGFQGWEEDLLNEVIVSLLSKPEDKLKELFSKQTNKIVNGRPTTHLDNYVIGMIHINATRPTAKFRKDVLGKKIISWRNRKATPLQTVDVELTEYETEMNEYDVETDLNVIRMHDNNIALLNKSGFDTRAIGCYVLHFINNQPFESFEQVDRDMITRIRSFLRRKKSNV